MSNLPGNPYVEAMKRAMDERPGAPLSHETVATLALAYEQRTANLISLIRASIEATAVNPGADMKRMHGEILARLGLGGESDG